MIYSFLRMKKSLENFKGFLKNLSVNFSVICLFQARGENQEESCNSNYIFDQPMTIFIGKSNIAEEEEYVSL